MCYLTRWPSASAINKARGTLLAIPLSTSAQEIPPLTIKLYFNGTYSCAVIDQMRALDKKRFIRKEGELTTFDVHQIEDGLRQVLCL